MSSYVYIILQSTALEDKVIQNFFLWSKTSSQTGVLIRSQRYNSGHTEKHMATAQPCGSVHPDAGKKLELKA